jgi:hypothetical protein
MGVRDYGRIGEEQFSGHQKKNTRMSRVFFLLNGQPILFCRLLLGRLALAFYALHFFKLLARHIPVMINIAFLEHGLF